MSNRTRQGGKGEAQRGSQGADAPAQSAPPSPPQHSIWRSTREWADAIIFAFVLAMFIRTFVVELFKIPSGSMSPTLIGDLIVREDYDGDSDTDLLVFKSEARVFQVFLKDGEDWDYGGEIPYNASYKPKLRPREDRILVNKFAYWFHPPRRGDLIVFRVPEQIWEADKAIYIKRAVGLGGETVEFLPTNGDEARQDRNRLVVDGQIVEEPPMFRRLRYSTFLRTNDIRAPKGEIEYAPSHSGRRVLRARVPESHVLALGDNTDYSSDGRYWGTVPVENLKGRAFLRFWPWRNIGFLR